MNISLSSSKKIYFASDFHLGAPSRQESRKREDRVIEWLEMVREDAAHIFLMGDLFDFWFEFKTVVPKGYVRFLGKLAELSDAGIPITVFTGNHDIWMFGYFEEELGVEVKRKPEVYQIGNQKLYLAHGDGLGPGDKVYKFLKVIFENRFFHWVFRTVHPDFGNWVAMTWSSSSRSHNTNKEEGFLGDDEWLWQYAKEIEAEKHHDFYVFGHRHLPIDVEVTENSRYINLGEWINYYTYAVYDGKKVELLEFGKE